MKENSKKRTISDTEDLKLPRKQVHIEDMGSPKDREEYESLVSPAKKLVDKEEEQKRSAFSKLWNYLWSGDLLKEFKSVVQGWIDQVYNLFFGNDKEDANEEKLPKEPSRPFIVSLKDDDEEELPREPITQNSKSRVDQLHEFFDDKNEDELPEEEYIRESVIDSADDAEESQKGIFATQYAVGSAVGSTAGFLSNFGAISHPAPPTIPSPPNRNVDAGSKKENTVSPFRFKFGATSGSGKSSKNMSILAQVEREAAQQRQTCGL